MKRLTLLLFLVATTICATAQNLRYIDASTLKIYGRTIPTEKSVYHRCDPVPYNFKNKTIDRYCTHSTGLYLLFRTNSTTIAASWEVTPHTIGDNMTGVFQDGLDLYIQRDGKWVTAGVGRIKTPKEINTYKRTIVKNMNAEEKLCLLYLPGWCEVKRLEIGIDANASFESVETPFRKRIITFGSSITHGASASRPGMTYTARMSRNLGLDFVNFGFSGNSKLQPQFAKLLADCEADAFLFDAFSNPTVAEIENRIDNFVATLVKAHPDKPLIFLQTHQRGEENFNLKWREFNEKRRETVRKCMAEMTRRYKNVYFLDGEHLVGEGAYGTVDGAHPTDLGFDLFIKAYQPRIAKILKRYGIK